MKRNLLFSVLIVLFFTACEEEPDSLTRLVGRWEWINSFGGFAGATYTPELTGDSIILEFTSESIYRKYFNDTLIIECKFFINDTILYNKSVKIINYEQGMIQQFYQLESSDKLILTDCCADCFVSTYKRIK